LFVYFSPDEDKWKLYRRTDGGAIQEYTVPFQNLVPETTYSFRVIAYNEYGISPPCTSEEEVGIYC
jgi:protein sidekick